MKSVSTSVSFPRDALDSDALAIVERLQAEGHTTYFVGGCVRDLLIGRAPKDFDIATEAHPETIKQIFGRRCRIIGRRFKLAHVHAGPKVLEVATFRGLPDDQETADDDSGFVVRANTFGPPEQDARSRDFTVNGLFYDPVARTLLDWVDGQKDVKSGVLRTIGDASARLREDPVRLLRAVKFAARLGFDVDQAIIDASAEAAPLIATCPMARVSEELFRICESGHARRAFEWMARLGIVDSLLPEVRDHFLADSPTRDDLFAWLDQIDRQTAAHGTLPREASYTLFVWPFVRQAIESRDNPWNLDWGKFARAATHEFDLRLGIPVRHRQTLEFSAELFRRMSRPDARRPTRGQLRSRSLPVALCLRRMEFLRTGQGADAYELWAGDAEQAGIWGAPFETRDEDLAEIQQATAPRHGDRPRGERRRRRRGRREDGDQSAG
ncbi:MAG: CCA tRNA nucleotidyltransferase [Deltaproteobacteria bacterium]|nr:CCA tRNA nucleotidyltransferase [Deltaproteobacteria bacterium]